MAERAPQIRTGIQEVDPRHALDVARLEEYVRSQIEEFDGSLAVRQFMGGQSNPTYLLSDGEREWVLRRKPPGKLVSSAHATDREFRVLTALGKTDLPVPRTRVYCKDESVIGTEFYLMDRVEGRILVDQSLPDWSSSERSALYESQISVLARLHSVDYAAIGLGDYGKTGNYFARQIHVWGKQYAGAERAEEDRSAAMERLMEWLPENIPDEDTTTLVHGDYGLNNIVLHPTAPRVEAVLDWELSTLGHPVSDVTYHLASRLSVSSPFAKLGDKELAELGIPTQAEYVARYCELAGRSQGIEELDFYLAFHLFRTAGIMFGIAARAKSGTAASAQAEELGQIAGPLAERGLELAKRLGA